MGQPNMVHHWFHPLDAWVWNSPPRQLETRAKPEFKSALQHESCRDSRKIFFWERIKMKEIEIWAEYGVIRLWKVQMQGRRATVAKALLCLWETMNRFRVYFFQVSEHHRRRRWISWGAKPVAWSIQQGPTRKECTEKRKSSLWCLLVV